MIARRPGKIRCKLARLLAGLGFVVDAGRLDTNDVYNRSTGGIAWQVYGAWAKTGYHVRVFSWDTMTECVQKGIVVCTKDESDCEVSVIDPK